MKMNNSSKEHTDIANPGAGELAATTGDEVARGDAFEGVEIVDASQEPNPEGVHEGRRSAAGSTYGDFNRGADGTRQRAPSEAYYDSNGGADVTGAVPAAQGAGDTTAVSTTVHGRSGPPPYPIVPGLDTADSVPERTDLPPNTNFQDG
jgi:hypothetical protein